ncbi:MAG: Asp-tRNA(Asn)/Glu-tRNA(Gln) amidotransferase subunit GatB [Planctomycetes bacterium]|nr:Asp-tRNA(Asn)/Glu-tRNA(Gln) amidotransferase subunit GatB [Planctomycetota bacterium]
MSLADYEPVIGLEVHVQLLTRTKMFCACENRFGAEPNTLTCPVCLGLPGSLPVLNDAAVELGVRAALATGARVADRSVFSRKQYFYPDLPKGYQISQYDRPLSKDGRLGIDMPQGRREIGIERLHLEEDAGKLIHEGDGPAGASPTRVDLNRAGVPLLEIVSRPDLRSSAEAFAYLTALKHLMKYAGVSDCEMQEGSLRCDVNVSIRRRGTEPFGTRSEVKNLNSFRGAERAIEHEIGRQAAVLDAGGTLRQETRSWDPDRERTDLMRVKEGASDYRYFPEPDLPPLDVGAARIEAVRARMPEFPEARGRRFIEAMGLSPYDARILTAEKGTADFFEKAASLAVREGVKAPHKTVANWIIGPLTEAAREMKIEGGRGRLEAEPFVRLIAKVQGGTVTQTTGKELLRRAMETGEDLLEAIRSGGLARIDDADAIEAVVRDVLAKNPKAIEDYRAGKGNAITFLVGQVMKATKGKANAQAARGALESILKGAS